MVDQIEYQGVTGGGVSAVDGNYLAPMKVVLALLREQVNGGSTREALVSNSKIQHVSVEIRMLKALFDILQDRERQY